MHTEVFAEKEEMPKEAEDNVKNCNEFLPEETELQREKKGWIPVEKSETGGAGDVRIIGCRLTVNNEASSLVKPGDTVEMYTKIQTAKTVNDLIIGYIFKDKYGNSIVGENTIGSGIQMESLEEGKEYIYKLQIRWPEVKEGDYFVTLGIGEGTDQMVHTIQCWAHNVIHVEAMSLVPMHGIINNPILLAEQMEKRN